jgi:hypothetical protein
MVCFGPNIECYAILACFGGQLLNVLTILRLLGHFELKLGHFPYKRRSESFIYTFLTGFRLKLNVFTL